MCFRKVFLWGGFLVVSSGLLSCSIKENRLDCPCHLYLDLSSVSRHAFDSLDVFLSSQKGIRCLSVPLPEDPSAPYLLEVEKSPLQLQVCALENGTLWLSDPEEDILKIPMGQQCPPVFTHFSYLDTRGDECVEKIQLRKNFCTLDITMVGNDPTQDYPFSLWIQGNVNGYDEQGRPNEGVFGVPLYPTRKGKCAVRVPRQKDDSLALSLCKNGEVLAEFALGNYMRMGGYDWSLADLKDISLKIDCAYLKIEVEIGLWKESYHFSVEI
ncbi:MAG: hypothetical protein IIX64_04300 [Bacteroidales bacterium]|nr:hypothetical protein [Bacteroidales bacterium]